MFKHVLAPVIGILVLIYPIYTSLWPIPAFPDEHLPIHRDHLVPDRSMGRNQAAQC